MCINLQWMLKMETCKPNLRKTRLFGEVALPVPVIYTTVDIVGVAAAQSSLGAQEPLHVLSFFSAVAGADFAGNCYVIT